MTSMTEEPVNDVGSNLTIGDGLSRRKAWLRSPFMGGLGVGLLYIGYWMISNTVADHDETVFMRLFLGGLGVLLFGTGIYALSDVLLWLIRGYGIIDEDPLVMIRGFRTTGLSLRQQRLIARVSFQRFETYGTSSGTESAYISRKFTVAFPWKNIAGVAIGRCLAIDRSSDDRDDITGTFGQMIVVVPQRGLPCSNVLALPIDDKNQQRVIQWMNRFQKETKFLINPPLFARMLDSDLIVYLGHRHVHDFFNGTGESQEQLPIAESQG